MGLVSRYGLPSVRQDTIEDAHSIVGRQLGPFLVLAITNEKRDKRPLYRCRCVCGREVLHIAKALKKRRTNVCACDRWRERPPVQIDRDSNTVRIPLQTGAFALIDYEDLCLAELPWYLNRDHVRRSGPRKEAIFLHRAVAQRMGLPDEMLVDHISGDTLDNRRANLRAVTVSQNVINRGLQRNNTSGHPGVTWRTDKQRWAAVITANGKTHTLGLFVSKEDAVAARSRAESELHGEYRRAR